MRNVDDKLYIWENIWRNDNYSNSLERSRRASLRFDNILTLIGTNFNFGRVVELGCGDGSFANLLLTNSKNQIQSYLGLDRSITAISKAKNLLTTHPNVNLVTSDLHNIPVENCIADTVIALGLLEHIYDVNQTLQEIQRICSPQATIILTMSNTLSAMYLDRTFKEYLGLWRYGYQKNYRLAELKKILEPMFMIKQMSVKQGDWDYKLVAVLDRIGSVIHNDIGRYIYIIASPLKK